jgi:hypothetical protein
MNSELILEKELAKYEELKPELLKTDEGKFVLIRDSSLIGVFESFDEGVKAGYQKFGNAPFLVKQIIAFDSPVNFISNLLAI